MYHISASYFLNFCLTSVTWTHVYRLSYNVCLFFFNWGHGTKHLKASDDEPNKLVHYWL